MTNIPDNNSRLGQMYWPYEGGAKPWRFRIDFADQAIVIVVEDGCIAMQSLFGASADEDAMDHADTVFFDEVELKRFIDFLIAIARLIARNRALSARRRARDRSSWRNRVLRQKNAG